MGKPGQKHDPGGKRKIPWPMDSKVDAVFSPCDKYRYELSEIWDPDGPLVLWILMNPSIADLAFRDPTLQRTGDFARDWGYGGQLVGNVHAYRATYKKELPKVDDPIGPDNDSSILRMADRAALVVFAFGKPPRKRLRDRGHKVVRLLSEHKNLSCLYLLADQETPKHPLGTKKDLAHQLWRGGRP